MTLASRIGPRLPPRLSTAVTARIYPLFEPELRRLDDFCPRGGTVVDVGGWYGPWSWHLARRADRVVTVEPVPHLARRLARTVPANVEVVAAAATDHPGTATLWLPPGGRGDRGVSSLIRRELHGTSLDVPCLTLDDLDLCALSFVKIDVDGAELDVLRGAERTVAREQPALFIELETRIQPLDPVLDWTAAHGYRGWVLPRDTWLPLVDFDLRTHQSHTSHVAEHGLLRRSLAPHRRYVNSVLFLPEGERPGAWTASAPPRLPPLPPPPPPSPLASFPPPPPPAAPFARPYVTMSGMSPIADSSPTPPTPPGPIRFQLVLLRRMADHQPGLVEDALRTLNVSRADLREANRRWQSASRSARAPGALARYRSLLGDPETTAARRIGDLTCRALTWPVPLWPDLRFEVLATDEGAVWNEWLVRAPGAAAPPLRTAADLVPWSCTVDEVARAFAPARPLEGTAPTRRRLAFSASGHVSADTNTERVRADYLAEFTWGLLQRSQHVQPAGVRH